jgi:hypothetical protein
VLSRSPSVSRSAAVDAFTDIVLTGDVYRPPLDKGNVVPVDRLFILILDKKIE